MRLMELMRIVRLSLVVFFSGGVARGSERARCARVLGDGCERFAFERDFWDDVDHFAGRSRHVIYLYI